MSYAHTLIPTEAEYLPAPARVRDFVRALRDLGATPIDPILQLKSDAERISWVDGNAVITPIPPSELSRRATQSLPGRQGRNPGTGKLLIIPRRNCVVPSDLEEVPLLLNDLNQYEFEISGAGPPKLPLLDLNSTDGGDETTFESHIRCCLSRQVVSTSDYHGDQPLVSEGQPFGESVDKTSGTGFFSNPETLETITVPSAGYARFWVEFELGKWVFPKINRALDLLHPSVVTAANETLGVNFAQGCRWD